jgi:hypothetical protein
MSQTRTRRNPQLVDKTSQALMKQNSQKAGRAAQSQLDKYASGYGQADVDNSWAGYYNYTRDKLNPETMYDDMLAGRDGTYNAMYQLSRMPIDRQYEQEYADLTRGQSARNLSDSSLGAYQRSLMTRQRDDLLMQANLQSQLGAADQKYNYGNVLRQMYGDAETRRMQPLQQAGYLSGLQSQAYQPVIQNNSRGYNTVKTGLGNYMDFMNASASIAGNAARAFVGV